MKTIATLLDIYLVLFLIAIAILLLRCSAPPTPNQNVDDYQNDTGTIHIRNNVYLKSSQKLSRDDSIMIDKIDSGKGGFRGIRIKMPAPVDCTYFSLDSNARKNVHINK